jgi:hypothetical protein
LFKFAVYKNNNDFYYFFTFHRICLEVGYFLIISM